MFKRILLVTVGGGLLVVAVILAFREKSIATVDVGGKRSSFAQMAPEELDMRAAHDALRFKHIVGQTMKLERKLDEDKDLFDRPDDKGLTADERAEALSLFEQTLDNIISLDNLARFHLDFFRLSVVGDPERHARHFALFFAAYLEKLALGLALVDKTINKPQFEELFDEGSQGYGIQPGAYKRLKWNVVHVEDAAAALAAHQWMRLLSGPLDKLAKADPQQWGFVLDRLEDRYAVVKGNLTSKSVKLFGGNSVDIGKDTAKMVWFPAQAKVAEEIGDARVLRLDQPLIATGQAEAAVKKSEPGDILVERRNWFLSNVALPGFWPHAAFYRGSQDELAAYFKDPDVDKAFGKPLPEYLEEHFPKAWNDYIKPDAHGDTIRVLEAMSEGVVFTSAEHSIGTADYVGDMRPMLSKVDKARAVQRAFLYAGRPYDFDFDFYTDETIVCSELVYKAYEPRKECAGVPLPLEKVMGRMTMGPNTIVRIFDQQYGTKDQRLDFAWFLDGHEGNKSASFEDLGVFRKTHLRPKWDVSQR